MTLRISLNNRHMAGPYGGGNQFAAGLEKFLRAQGHQVYRELVPDLDVILILSPRRNSPSASYFIDDIHEYVRRWPRTATVLRVNTLDEQRGADLGDNRAMLAAAPHVDHIVYVSDFIRQAFRRHGIDATKPDSVILNAADEAIFHPHGRQRWQPGQKMRLVTHHWSPNFMKGFDIYERLDLLLAQEPYRDRFEFTFIGNVCISVTFAHTRCLPVLHGPELADALRGCHVYLSAARHEPGGNHYIEGGQCGLPVLFLETGSLREYCGAFGLGFTPITFEQQLLALPQQYPALFEQAQHAPHTAQRMSQAYETLFRQVVAQRRAQPLPAAAPHTPLRPLRRLWGRAKKAARVLRDG